MSPQGILIGKKKYEATVLMAVKMIGEKKVLKKKTEFYN